jgi:hypothetical protein
MIFEGLTRKLLFKEFSVEIQVIRDLLPGVALFAYLAAHGKSLSAMWPRSWLGVWLSLYVTAGVAEFLNPELWSPLVGLLGLRTHFAYIPLLLLAPVYIRTEEQLILRLAALCAIAVPVVALGVIQTHLPASHPLNADIEASFGEMSLVRASGTFSYISGYGVFCQFVLVAAMALLILRPLHSRTGALAAVGACFAFVGCLSSGSRGPVFGAALQLGLLGALLLWSRMDVGASVVLKLAVIAVVIGGIAVTRVPDIYESFRERVIATASDVDVRLSSGFFGWLRVLAFYPLGEGIGMAHQQAGTLVGRVAGFLSGYESELSRIAYELGIPGFGAMAAFRLSLLLRIGFGMRRLRDRTRATVAGVSLSTIALLLTGGVYTPMANALLYLTAGMGLAAVASPRTMRVPPAQAGIVVRRHTEAAGWFLGSR